MLIDIPEIYTRNNYERVLSVMEELQTKLYESYCTEKEHSWMYEANKFLYYYQDDYYSKQIELQIEQEEAYYDYLRTRDN